MTRCRATLREREKDRTVITWAKQKQMRMMKCCLLLLLQICVLKMATVPKILNTMSLLQFNFFPEVGLTLFSKDYIIILALVLNQEGCPKIGFKKKSLLSRTGKTLKFVKLISQFQQIQVGREAPWENWLLLSENREERNRKWGTNLRK